MFSLSFVTESRDWLSETLSVDKWLNISRKNDMLVKWIVVLLKDGSRVFNYPNYSTIFEITIYIK